jgi:hypothetical protein
MSKIDDGVGSGRQASVNGRNELDVFAVVESELESANDNGLAYNLNSGEVTGITSGDATLIYFKNGEAATFVINAVAVGLRGFTSLTDMAVLTVIKNPTAGDLVSDATPISINSNSNFGSSNVVNNGSDLFKGKNSGTITGGEDHAIIYAGNNSRVFAVLNMELSKGASIAVKVVGAGASAGNAYCALVGHLKDEIRNPK